MASRAQIEQGLEDIGACWAVRSDKYISPNDDFDAEPTYHVHPDASYPHQNHIKTFDSLRELWSWIQACKESAALHEQDGEFHEVVYTSDGYGVVR
jgi:hypothetical protein